MERRRVQPSEGDRAPHTGAWRAVHVMHSSQTSPATRRTGAHPTPAHGGHGHGPTNATSTLLQTRALRAKGRLLQRRRALFRASSLCTAPRRSCSKPGLARTRRSQALPGTEFAPASSSGCTPTNGPRRSLWCHLGASPPHHGRRRRLALATVELNAPPGDVRSDPAPQDAAPTPTGRSLATPTQPLRGTATA